MRIVATLSFAPDYVDNYEDYLSCALMCGATFTPDDLERVGVVLEQLGFKPIPRDLWVPDAPNVPQDISAKEIERKMDMGSWDGE